MQDTSKNQPGLQPLKFPKVQGLIDAQKKVRLAQAKDLLRYPKSGDSFLK